MINKFNHAIASLIMLVAFAGTGLNPVFAANLPSGYPALNEFQSIGIVDSLEARANKIVIDDQEFTISSNVIIVVPNKRNSSVRDIRTGKTTGIFFSDGTVEEMPVVNEIWVFPLNF